MFVLKNIVDVKLLLDKKLDKFYYVRHIRIILYFVESCRKPFIGPITENQQFSSHPKCFNWSRRFKHVGVLWTYFP